MFYKDIKVGQLYSFSTLSNDYEPFTVYNFRILKEKEQDIFYAVQTKVIHLRDKLIIFLVLEKMDRIVYDGYYCKAIKIILCGHEMPFYHIVDRNVFYPFNLGERNKNENT